MTDSILRELADESRPVLHSSLLQLSGSPPEVADAVESAWPAISQRRKNDIVARMLELANDNPELDFEELFLRLLNDPSEDLREMAARGLWECEDRAAIRPLTDLLLRDPSAGVQEAVGEEHLAVLSPIDDIRGTGEYRMDAALTLVRRTLAELGSA